MSFILDALRKSETERQNAQVPGIGDAPLVVHQKHVPRWTVGLIACLSVSLVVLGWFWLRDTGTDTGQEAAGLGASSTQTTTGGAVSPNQTAADGAASSARTTGGDTASSTPLPVPIAAMAPVARPDGDVRDLSAEARQITVAPGPASTESPAAQAAVEQAIPASLAAPMLTLAQYRASGGALPELNLELHVYSPAAAERFVFINSAKYVEGETLAEGPRLGAITRDGAVLVYQGRSLLLPRE